MIDIESDVFSIVSKAIREQFPKEKYPKLYITGEYVVSPPSFPCVSIIETDNQVYRNSRTFDNVENHAQLLYEVNVYTNDERGKKALCKSIISLIDLKMAEMGFSRTLLNEIPNQSDSTIYRKVARYRAIVSEDKVIYRR